MISLLGTRKTLCDGLSRRDLLPGVRVARGWTQEELRREAAAPPRAGRRITRLCS